MNEIGWRTVIVHEADNLNIDSDQLVFSDSSMGIPIEQIKDLVVANEKCSISVPLLNVLIDRHVNVVLCDKRKDPSAVIMPVAAHTNVSGNIHSQINWDQELCDTVWSRIVKEKIENQILTLNAQGIECPEKLIKYKNAVRPGDASNREAQAARTYFQALFGKGFARHSDDRTNSALDYGYTILRTAASRIVSVHGYCDSIGIHHRNDNNPYNLACDLMEPFRPSVDAIVYTNKGRDLDWEYKKDLIAVLQADMLYGGTFMKLNDAMDRFAIDIFRSLKSGKKTRG